MVDAARQIGVSEQTVHRWRKQYGGMSRDQLMYRPESGFQQATQSMSAEVEYEDIPPGAAGSEESGATPPSRIKIEPGIGDIFKTFRLTHFPSSAD